MKSKNTGMKNRFEGTTPLHGMPQAYEIYPPDRYPLMAHSSNRRLPLADRLILHALGVAWLPEDQNAVQLDADVEIRFEDTVALFQPLTHRAARWMNVRVSEPVFFGNALVVEQRFAKQVAGAMKRDGLRLA